MQEVWSAVQGSLRARLGVENYEIWIEPIRLSTHSGTGLKLRMPNRYFCDWVKENFGQAITEEFHRLVSAPIPVDFLVEETDGTENAEPGGATAAVAPAPPADRERPFTGIPGVALDKTFRNFVVGKCNQFAHAASLAVAESPGAIYNPLFIYGDTGLGKTHLMHAIGNAMRERDVRFNVVYVTAEQFTNDLIESLRHRRMHEFRDRYRKLPDMLLIDDVQFLSNKEATQEELFHTFEDLHKRGKQIVLTADVLPRDIKMLEPRLRSRFESGMLADTQAPDVETMVAILRQKADSMGLGVQPDLAQWICSRVRGNVRELEGALIRLKAAAKLQGVEPDLDLARKHLVGILPEAPPCPSVDEIISVVSSFYNLKPADLQGARRLKQVVRPRHVAMYLIRKHTELSFPDIGRVFGNRDHATVQHAVKKIASQFPRDADLQNVIETIERTLQR